MSGRWPVLHAVFDFIAEIEAAATVSPAAPVLQAWPAATGGQTSVAGGGDRLVVATADSAELLATALGSAAGKAPLGLVSVLLLAVLLVVLEVRRRYGRGRRGGERDALNL